MMRRLTAVVAAVGVLCTASIAGAQAHAGFAQDSGQLIFSADRLFSLFSYTHISQDSLQPPAGTKQSATVNGTAISLLWGSSPVVTAGGGTVISPFTVPRVGFDYVIVPKVTVGGDLVVFFTLGGNTATDTTANNGGATTSNSASNPSQLLFGVAPRGGYVLALTDLFSVWLRGGFSYYVQTAKTTNQIGNNQQTISATTNQFALDLDPQFVITPVPHIGITAGLTLDIPITGGHSQETDLNGASNTLSASSSILFLGVTAGLLVYF